MEAITKFTIMHKQLTENKNVLCSKSLAKQFYIFLKMLDIDVNYELSGAKILFTLK